MDKNKSQELHYYSVWGHRCALICWLILSFACCVFLLPWLLRWIYLFYDKIAWAGTKIPDSQDTYGISALPDFLGGLFGIVIGFCIDATIISRWQHLKRYEMLLGTLSVELTDILGEFNSKEFGNVYNKYQAIYNLLSSSCSYMDFNKSIGHFDNNIELFKKLFNYLKQTSECSFINDADDFEEYIARDKECSNLIAEYYQFISINDYAIEMPILDDVIDSAEDLFILHNLPRYFWGRKKGLFARQVVLIHKLIQDWNEKIMPDKPDEKCYADERLILRKEIINEILIFLKATNKKYEVKIN